MVSMTHLEKKVKIVKDVFLYGRNYTNRFRDLFINGDIELIEAEWYDSWKKNNLDMYPLDLTNVDLWSIYDKCGDMWIKYDNGKIIAEVNIYEGSFYDGHREELRWSGSFLFNKKSLKEFKDSIDWKFEAHLSELYDKELEEKKKHRMSEIGKEILK